MARLLTLSLTFAVLLASQGAGVIEGTIQDLTGAALPNAVVEVVGTAGGQTRKVRSTGGGEYAFSALAPGRYRIQATYTGFNTASREVLVIPGARVALTLQLSPANVSEQVQVAASAEMLQTAGATQSAALNAEQIQNLPSASRNFTHLIVGEAGVSAPLPDRTGRGLNLATAPGGQGDDGTQSLNPSVNGARPTNNSLAINGMDATNMMNGNGSLGNNINVPLDALEVVEVQTALYSATQGRNGGGNIQLITKSGTNDFHGSILPLPSKRTAGRQ